MRSSTRYVGHFPSWLINDIANIKLGNSKFKTALKDFVSNYKKLIIKRRLNEENEEQLVKNTIELILRADTRFISGVGSLEILQRFERFFIDIRDHYFHSFHIFLLGLLILDRYTNEFTRYYKNIFPKYKNLSIEYIWMLTSIFHDVGYPITKLDDMKEDIYGTSANPLEKDTTEVWEDHVYKTNLTQLLSLTTFCFSKNKHRVDWCPEVFGQQNGLKKVFRECYFNSHGVAGCFRFLVDIFREAQQERGEEKKLFLINHIYPAALSIALHDTGFRIKLQSIGFKRLFLSRFPFAVLLIFLDSLQEDKRDKFLCIESTEFLQGFEYNCKVKAQIDERVLSIYPRLHKIKDECKNFLSGIECDGIKFEYPDILVV